MFMVFFETCHNLDFQSYTVTSVLLVSESIYLLKLQQFATSLNVDKLLLGHHSTAARRPYEVQTIENVDSNKQIFSECFFFYNNEFETI